jgi:hypothetical protein
MRSSAEGVPLTEHDSGYDQPGEEDRTVYRQRPPQPWPQGPQASPPDAPGQPPYEGATQAYQRPSGPPPGGPGQTAQGRVQPPPPAPAPDRTWPAAPAPGTPPPGSGAPGQAAPGQAAPGQAGPGQAAPGNVPPGTAPPGTAPPWTAGPGTAGPGTAGGPPGAPGAAWAGQPGQAAAGPQAGWAGSPPPQTDARGFVASLFDFSFTSYVTPKVVKVLYALIMVGVALGAVIFVAIAFRASSVFGLISLFILAPLYFLVVMAIYRIGLEFFMVMFRISEDIRAIRQRNDLH